MKCKHCGEWLQHVDTRQLPPQFSETEIGIARNKSYVWPVVLVVFLYCLYFIPGLIANILFLNDAKRMATKAGQDLPGAGCLTTLLHAAVVFMIVMAVVSIAIFLTVGARYQ